MSPDPHSPPLPSPSSAAERLARSTATGGEPADDMDGTSPYLQYESIDTLLSLQHPRTDEPAELTFYIMGQVKELLFKLLHAEFTRARDLLFQERLSDAIWVLRRAESTQRVLESTWEPLSALTPSEFNAFRDHLGTASGLQSYMFRQLEFILGNKSRRLAQIHRRVPVSYEPVMESLAAPSLWDAAIWTLSRLGYQIDSSCLARDWTSEYTAHPSVVDAWAAVYANPAKEPQTYRLAEALSTVAYRHHRWRSIHLLVVERLIGNQPGTGGTSGLAWLRRSAENRIFPELLLNGGPFPGPVA